MDFKRPPRVIAPLPSTIYPMTPDGVAAWVTSTMQARRPTYQRLFDQYIDARRVHEGATDELRTNLNRVDPYRVDPEPYPGNLVEHLRFVEQRYLDVGLAAETLLLPLDAMLSSLRFALTSCDRCTDDGPELRNDVMVDRAIDAIGNYVRHRHEWFSHDYAKTWPTKQQMWSVKPLAQLHTSRTIEDAEDAYMEFTEISLPPAFVLDLLGNYSVDGPDMSFGTVESMVYSAALNSIKRRFAYA